MNQKLHFTTELHMFFESCQKSFGWVKIFYDGLKIVLELQKDKKWKTEFSKYTFQFVKLW